MWITKTTFLSVCSVSGFLKEILIYFQNDKCIVFMFPKCCVDVFKNVLYINHVNSMGYPIHVLLIYNIWIYVWTNIFTGIARSGVRSCYTNTRKQLMIDRNTKVICQGFTGKQVCNVLKKFSYRIIYFEITTISDPNLIRFIQLNSEYRIGILK